jgi:hypothetical protein
MHSDFIDSEKLVPALILAVVLLLVAVLVFPGIGPFGSDLTATYTSAVEVSHSPTSETVTVRLISGDSYERPFTDALVVSRSEQIDEAAGVTVAAAGRTNSHGVWAGRLPSTDRSGVLGLPVSVDSNATVRVTADGTDSDGDGTAGIERGETLYILFVGDLEPDRPWTERGTTVVDEVTVGESSETTGRVEST